MTETNHDHDKTNNQAGASEQAGGELQQPYSRLAELLPLLNRLDQLLQQAIQGADTLYGPDAATDPYRGLYIDQEEVVRLLQRAPGEPAFGRADACRLAAPALDDPHSQLAAFRHRFGLAPFDVDLLIVALAPDLERRYERLYAYLQDDVSRRRPTVDLALNLLCRSAAEKLLRRNHFAPEAPLIKQRLLHLIPEDEKMLTPLLAHALKVDEQVVTLLLGQQTLDPRLQPFCRLVRPQEAAAQHDAAVAHHRAGLLTLVRATWRQEVPLHLYFEGPRGNEQRLVAANLAAAIGAPLLEVDLAGALEADPALSWAPRLIFREAHFQHALTYMAEVEASFPTQHGSGWQRLLTELHANQGITILSGANPWTPTSQPALGVVTIPFELPDFAARRTCWQQHLHAAGLPMTPVEIDTLAGRFRLTPAEIAAAVATATKLAWLRGEPDAETTTPATPSSAGAADGGEPAVTLPDLFAAARAQSGHDLAISGTELGVQKITPVYQWEDIVLPQDTVAQLREICERVEHQPRVLGAWGFGRKLSRGKGINALFAGASGTGKTMAAEILANALGLDLYKIDLSHVVSKYIGETEKKLERIFTSAAHANVILFFDEADALFGKRSEVKDAHDRYANIEISYLLQKLEDYEGLVILATNMRNNLDSAFVRRMAFIVQFPQPEEADRLRIWQTIWPPATPCAPDLDFAFMARQFKLSGGNIKNIALAAAFLAAGNGQVVSTSHLIWATRRELQKMGKTAVPLDFGPYGHLLEGRLLEGQQL
jgi:SpoVK/Ycf46/Vps4 family AAA+-type ATPase